jgi:hypothetical protein
LSIKVLNALTDKFIYNNSAKLFSFLLCGKNSFISFNSQLPEKLKTFIEGKVDNMHEVFNSAVDAKVLLKLIF